MRGSIYHQTALLAKTIFTQGAKKQEKTDPHFNTYQHVSSFKTMETYRRVWNNFGIYLKDEYGIKDFEKTSPHHIESYMLSKVDTMRSKQYLEKISSALGKLQIALNKFSCEISQKNISFDFSIRQILLDNIRKEDLVFNGYHNRAYDDAMSLINTLSDPNHQLAAKIQLASGARFEGVGLIKLDQLKDSATDTVTGKEIWQVETTEKGGKTGMIHLTRTLYIQLMIYFTEHTVFKIDYQAYAHDIRSSCKHLGIKSEGTHGLRWTFAQVRIRECQSCGYTYEQSLLIVSNEMKHNRVSISEHYLGI